MDSNACNYSETASEDNGRCEYAIFPYDCDGMCADDLEDCMGECVGSAILDIYEECCYEEDVICGNICYSQEDEIGDCCPEWDILECSDGTFVCDSSNCP